jgi:phosphopantetheinyl transferase
MRHEVGQRLGIPAPSVPFERSPQGKPFLADQSLHVNLSHTQGCLVLALCDTHAVGVDVEWLARPVRPALANKFFSPTEWAEINALPTEDDRRQRFLQVWTLKEAWWKAHDPPYGFDMTQLTAHWQPLALWNDAADQPLGTVQSWADAKHRFALAVTASDASLSVTQLPPSLLDLGR